MRIKTAFVLPLLLGTVGLIACSSGDSTSDGGEDGATSMSSAVTYPECRIAPATERYPERGTPEEVSGRSSPLLDVTVDYENGVGRLCYGAPSARDREVMGGLVPFGNPWRAGANEPTTLHLTAPALLGTVPTGGPSIDAFMALDPVFLEAGSYSLYAIPGEDEWEIFVNPNHERWGIPITDEVRSTEIGSFKVVPEATDEMVETMSYDYNPIGENTMGTFSMMWENTRVSFHLHPGG